MRLNLRTALPVTLAVATLAACGVDIDFWDERAFDVDVPAESEKAIETTLDVDLQEHAEFKEKVTQLKDVDVVEIWLEVPSVEADNKATKVSGRLEVSGLDDGAEKILVAEYKDLNIGAGGKVQLDWDAQGYEKLKSFAFDSPHKFRLHLVGSLDEVPAKFKLETRLHVVATVSI